MYEFLPELLRAGQTLGQSVGDQAWGMAGHFQALGALWSQVRPEASPDEAAAVDRVKAGAQPSATDLTVINHLIDRLRRQDRQVDDLVGMLSKLQATAPPSINFHGPGGMYIHHETQQSRERNVDIELSLAGQAVALQPGESRRLDVHLISHLDRAATAIVTVSGSAEEAVAARVRHVPIEAWGSQRVTFEVAPTATAPEAGERQLSVTARLAQDQARQAVKWISLKIKAAGRVGFEIDADRRGREARVELHNESNFSRDLDVDATVDRLPVSVYGSPLHLPPDGRGYVRVTDLPPKWWPPHRVELQVVAKERGRSHAAPPQSLAPWTSGLAAAGCAVILVVLILIGAVHVVRGSGDSAGNKAATTAGPTRSTDRPTPTPKPPNGTVAAACAGSITPKSAAPTTSPTPAAEAETGAAIYSGANYNAELGAVFVASDTGRVFALDAANLTEIWHSDCLGSRVAAQPSLSSSLKTLWAVTEKGLVYAFDVERNGADPPTVTSSLRPLNLGGRVTLKPTVSGQDLSRLHGEPRRRHQLGVRRHRDAGGLTAAEIARLRGYQLRQNPTSAHGTRVYIPRRHQQHSRV